MGGQITNDLDHSVLTLSGNDVSPELVKDLKEGILETGMAAGSHSIHSAT